MVSLWFERAWIGNRWEKGVRLRIADGRIAAVETSVAADGADERHRAGLPGLCNVHSHGFQRGMAGLSERRSRPHDNFWSWREIMYRFLDRLTPEDVAAITAQAYAEMLETGFTRVGEFHYLHHAPDGSRYDDPNLLAREVIRAARDVGIRIALLRVAYARAGYQTDPNPQQVRFIEDSPDVYLKNLEQLLDVNDDMAWIGVAPHSVRAVPLDYLKTIVAFANERGLPVHMHVAEQPAEVSACIAEYGRSPVALLETEGLLSKRFTAVHAIHVTPKAIAALARSGAFVCACPTTERNLGDGVVPADAYFDGGVRIALGSDSQIQIDLLEDARELEYHLRLQKMERNVLAPMLAERLFDCATINGAASIGFDGGRIKPGAPADFFTVDLNDLSIAGSSPDDLLTNIVFSLARTAVRDVVVAGKRIIENGKHQADTL